MSDLVFYGGFALAALVWAGLLAALPGLWRDLEVEWEERPRRAPWTPARDPDFPREP